MSLFGGIVDAVGGFLGSSAKKKQTKNMIRDYDAAQTGSLNALNEYQPYLQGGQTGFQNALAMQTPGYDYESNDPGYAYNRDEQLRAVERSAAARGALNSGGTVKDIMRTASGLAAQDFDKSFQRSDTLGRYGLAAASGFANGTQNALFKAADGRSGAREMRGDAIADQWGSGADAVKTVAGFFGF